MRKQPAADALLRVMEHQVATGGLLVPDGARFVDAAAARAGRSIAEALDGGSVGRAREGRRELARHPGALCHL